MSAFAGSFIQYFIFMVILAALAVAGVFVGRFLRIKKDGQGGTEDKDKI